MMSKTVIKKQLTKCENQTYMVKNAVTQSNLIRYIRISCYNCSNTSIGRASNVQHRLSAYQPYEFHIWLYIQYLVNDNLLKSPSTFAVDNEGDYVLILGNHSFHIQSEYYLII